MRVSMVVMVKLPLSRTVDARASAAPWLTLGPDPHKGETGLSESRHARQGGLAKGHVQKKAGVGSHNLFCCFSSRRTVTSRKFRHFRDARPRNKSNRNAARAKSDSTPDLMPARICG